MVTPPVTPGPLLLPLNDVNVSWERFQAFCVQFVDAVLDCAKTPHEYGKHGEPQDGIDIFAELNPGPRTAAIQCRRRKAFTAGDLVNLIRETTFPADEMYVAVTCEVGRKVRDEVKKHPGWEVWDVKDISAKVRSLPLEVAYCLIAPHFGSLWAEQFLGHRPGSGRGDAGFSRLLVQVQFPMAEIDLGERRQAFARDLSFFPVLVNELVASSCLALAVDRSELHAVRQVGPLLRQRIMLFDSSEPRQLVATLLEPIVRDFECKGDAISFVVGGRDSELSQSLLGVGMSFYGLAVGAAHHLNIVLDPIPIAAAIRDLLGACRSRDCRDRLSLMAGVINSYERTQITGLRIANAMSGNPLDVFGTLLSLDAFRRSSATLHELVASGMAADDLLREQERAARACANKVPEVVSTSRLCMNIGAQPAKNELFERLPGLIDPETLAPAIGRAYREWRSRRAQPVFDPDLVDRLSAETEGDARAAEHDEHHI